MNLYLSTATKWAFPTAAQAADSPSDVREQAVMPAWHVGSAVPHMYMPTSTELGSQQKSFRLWKTAAACAAVYPSAVYVADE